MADGRIEVQHVPSGEWLDAWSDEDGIWLLEAEKYVKLGKVYRLAP
jgi:hypothetical protein